VIPNDALINALRKLGYKFKDQKDRVALYKKPGSTARIGVRRIDLHDEQAVRILLKQAGMPQTEIESFINNYKTNH